MKKSQQWDENMQFVWICVITYHNILEIKMNEIKTKTMCIN